MGAVFKLKINNQDIWVGLLSKQNGEKISPARFFIRPLEKKDAQEMAHLSKEIYHKLLQHEQCYIHQHTSDYFETVFDKKDISYIGVFCDNKLIAMSYLRILKNQEDFLSEIPGFQKQTFSNGEKVASLGGDCVHPMYRGNGLNQLMIEYRLEKANRKLCQAVYSIIDRNNHWNMPPYFNNRFQMLSCGIDPSDGGDIAVMRYKKEKRAKTGAKIAVSSHHFDIIDRLIDSDYVGHEYNPKTKEISFSRPVEIPLPITRSNLSQHFLNQTIRKRQYV